MMLYSLALRLADERGSAGDWVVITVLGVFQVGLAYALLVRGVAGVPALRASLIMMIEPALSTLLAWLVHSEAPHPLAASGGVVILGSVLAGGALARRQGPTSG